MRYLRLLVGASNEDLAIALEKPTDHVAHWEAFGFPHGNDILFYGVTEGIASVFRCSLTWLRDGLGEAPKHARFIKVQTIEIECGGCDGSGVYPPHDVSQNRVVCRGCEGKGSRTIKYVAFAGRNLRTDVTTVATNHLSDHSGSVSYEDFLAGKLP